MEILSAPTEDWSGKLTCGRCGTKIVADQSDVRLDGFKVSGHHFAGTAVVVDKFFVECPTDGIELFLREDVVLPVPLRDRLRGELAERRSRLGR